MLQSEFTWIEWLEAVARGYTPWGDKAEVVRVNHTDELEVSDQAEFRAQGKHDPRFLGRNSRRFKEYRIYNSSLIYDGEIGAVYVCATDDEIKEAKAMMEHKRQEASESASPQHLIDFLIKCWQVREWSFWRYHLPERPNDETFSPSEKAADTIHSALECGQACEAWLSKMPDELSNALRQSLRLPSPDERLKVFNKAYRTYKGLRDEVKGKYIQEQQGKIVELGFSWYEAKEIVRVCGPALALRATQWAIEAREQVRNPKALFAVLTKASQNGHSRDWAVAELYRLDVLAPKAKADSAFFGLLRGARQVMKADRFRPQSVMVRKDRQQPTNRPEERPATTEEATAS